MYIYCRQQQHLLHIILIISVYGAEEQLAALRPESAIKARPDKLEISWGSCMWTKHLFVLVHTIKSEVGTIKLVWALWQFFYWPFQSCASFVKSFLLFMFRAFHAVLSVHCSLMVTCWERSYLLARLFVMLSCVFLTFPCGVRVRCGTWLYRFLIFAFFITLTGLDLWSNLVVHSVSMWYTHWWKAQAMEPRVTWKQLKRTTVHPQERNN